MMAIDFGSHGLNYTREICSAIEHYTASAVKRDSKAYNYRGMELRYAVERSLYIQCINSEALFYCYLARIGVQSALVNSPLNSIEKDIAFFLCNQRAVNDFPPRRIWQWLLGTARRASDSLRRWRPWMLLAQIPVAKYDILIHVINKKFAHYLTPVTSELEPGAYAFLTTSDVELRKQLTQSGFPVVGVPTLGSFSKYIFCSYALSDFLQIMRDADATLASLRKLSPGCVLVVEGNAPMDVVTSEAAYLLGIPCYCVQQGWSPYVHNGFRNMKFTEMFVWGRRFAEMLRPYNAGQVFRVTGNHALNTVKTLPNNHNVSTLSFFLQAPCALLGVKAYDDFIDLIIAVAQDYPNIRIVVREHPSYPLPSELRQKIIRHSNILFSIPSTEPLAMVIAVSDLVISVFSSVLLEAIAMDVVPLICSIGAMKSYEPDIAVTGAAIEVQSIADARRTIDQVIAEPTRLIPIRKSISKISGEFFSSENSAKTIATELIRVSKKKIARGH